MGDFVDLFNAYRAPAQHLISLLLAGAVWRWGGAPERWSMTVFIVTMVVPIYVVAWFSPVPAEVGPYAGFYVLIDLVAAGLFVAIALNANRNYPLWVAGFQLVAVFAHLVKAAVDSVSPLAFAILMIGPSYVQLLLLAGGFLRHVQRQSRFGPYREWRLAAPGARRFGP